jgi:hypothetical protein
MTHDCSRRPTSVLKESVRIVLEISELYCVFDEQAGKTGMRERKRFRQFESQRVTSHYWGAL